MASTDLIKQVYTCKQYRKNSGEFKKKVKTDIWYAITYILKQSRFYIYADYKLSYFIRITIFLHAKCLFNVNNVICIDIHLVIYYMVFVTYWHRSHLLIQ